MSNVMVSPLTRVFQYNGVELADIDPVSSPATVKDFYAAMYPELATAEVEGPETKGDKLIYKFKRSAGTKGAGRAADAEGRPARPFVERLAAIAEGQPDPTATDNSMACPSAALMDQIVLFRNALLIDKGTPLQLPSSAIALML